MVWNPGDDDDINEGGDGNDTVEVNGGGAEEFEVKPAAVPGRVSFDRTNPAPFNIDIGSSEQLVLNAGDGDDKMPARRARRADQQHVQRRRRRRPDKGHGR